jgi:hypothetical protein
MRQFHPHATVLSPPAIAGLLSHTDLLAGFTYSTSLTEENLTLPELADDLFGCVRLPAQTKAPVPSAQSLTSCLD